MGSLEDELREQLEIEELPQETGTAESIEEVIQRLVQIDQGLVVPALTRQRDAILRLASEVDALRDG
jgi:hypothetical protein